MTPHIFWQPTYSKCDRQHFPTHPVSEGCPSIRNLPPSLMCYWVGCTCPVGPSYFDRRSLGVWGGHCACFWVIYPFWPGLRPYHIAHYNNTWWGRPSWNIMYEILRTKHHIHHSVRAGLEVRFHIIGIHHPSINLNKDPHRLTRTELLTATPSSSFCGGDGYCTYERVPWT